MMIELEELTSEWKKMTKDSALMKSTLTNYNNTSIMNTIINYEKLEIEDKRKSKIGALFFTIVFVTAIIPQISLGNINLNTSNTIGFFFCFYLWFCQ